MPSQNSVLIIEDDKSILELLKYQMTREGYKVFVAQNGEQGIEASLTHKPDVILLDWMLPKMDGLEVCRMIRQNSKISTIPILMLTAKSQEIDKVMGLQLGADDYVTKPFSQSELAARVKALIRRTQMKPKSSVFKIGTLVLNDEKHVVSVKNQELTLTSKEYDLLKTLVEANGKVLTRHELLARVWNYDEPSNIETRTIDMHIRLLRKKLGAEAERIVTIKNVGYRMNTD